MRFAYTRLERGSFPFWSMLLVLICLGGMLGLSGSAVAQTGGMAGIQGLVQDPTGAVVPNATVTATSDETHVVTVRQTTGEGIYTISPLLPGSYTVKVEAPGFAQFQQTNFSIDALKMTPLNVTLKAGAESETVIVSEAPPALDTNSATLGSVMENKQYAQLPVQMNSQQRDPLSFATLMPGAQGGTRAPVIAGTGNYLSELYLDGIPETVANMQGDNRVISNAVGMDAIDQFQLQTSSIPPEFQGAGVVNFTMKHGGADYHGSANIYVRNTIFDTWTYAQKYQQAVNGTKPNRYENKNEITATLGGPVPVPYLRNKVFFFYAFSRFHSRVGADPTYMTAPNAKMRSGDFSQFLTANGGPGYILYDPTTQAACTAANNNTICRYPFGQSSGKPDDSLATNVIPSGRLSPISQYLQKFLPTDVDNTKIVNNYLGGAASGFDNVMHNARLDYRINDNHTLSFIYARGVRENAPYSYTSTGTLPYPYVQGSKAKLIIDLANAYYTYTISPHMVNNMKFGFMYFGGPPTTAATDTGSSSSIYSAVSAGITNLPAGQASNLFPSVSFGSGTYSPLKWTTGGGSGATYTSKSNNYAFGDNLLYTRGRHALTFGFTYQMLEANGDSYDGASSPLSLTFAATPTAQLASTSSIVTNTGSEYASFLLGGVGSTSLSVQKFGVVGGRYHPFAPYINDDYQVNSKLTLNLGFRWDYLPPYVEAKDRWSFLNPGLTNPLTGNLGMMQFAGHGDYTCNCRTPVQTWWKNFGPRLGLSYQLDSKTVVHAGYGMYYSHGGGVGGRTGAFNGTGQNGFSASAAVSAADAQGPAFWLNSSNSAYGGSSYTLPTPAGISLAGQEQTTSYYLDGTGTFQRTSSSVGYADPYRSSRAPNISFFNVGVQRVVRNSLTLAVNYSGSESHFLPTGSTSDVGYWSNQLDPRYMVGLSTTKTAKNANILSAQATSANIALARAAMPGISVPYVGYENAGNKNAAATIQQMLVHFPQYAGVTNTWGQNVGNNAYHALQISLIERGWKGLNYQINYTFSKNIGDDGTYRDGYDIPSDAIDAGGKSFKRGQADRSWTAIAIPQTLNFFGVYSLPFGKGKIGGNNEWVNMLASNWGLSWKYSYSSGNPLAITATSCSSTGGTCMPNLNPNYTKKTARTGKWAWKQSGIDSSAFIAPAFYGSSQVCTSNCTQKFGNAPRTRAYSLSEPSTYGLDMSMKRKFSLPYRNFKLSVEANCMNVTHKHTFSDIGTTLPTASGDRSYGSSTSFGVPTSASGNRDWQFASHITF